MKNRDSYIEENMNFNSVFLLGLISSIYIIFPLSILTKEKIYYFFILFVFFYLILLSLNNGCIRLIKTVINIKTFIFLYLSFLISSAWSININNSLLSLLYSSYSICLLLIINYFFESFINEEKKISYFYYIIYICTLSCFSSSLIILYFYGSLRPSDLTAAKKVGSFSNVVAAMVEVCLIYFIYYFKWRKSISCILGIVASIFIVLISQSRSSFIIVLITVFFIPFLYRYNIANRLLYCLKIFSIFIVITVLIFKFSQFFPHKNIEIFNRFKKIDLSFIGKNNIERRAGTDYRRKIQYIASFDIVNNNTFLGIGYASFKEYVKKKYNVNVSCHNVFFIVMTSSGVLGLSLFIFMLIKLFYTIQRKKNYFQKFDKEISDFYLTTNFALFAMLLHAQFRVLFDNFIFILVIGIVLTRLDEEKHKL